MGVPITNRQRVLHAADAADSTRLCPTLTHQQTVAIAGSARPGWLMSPVCVRGWPSRVTPAMAKHDTITARVPLTTVEQVDEEVLDWLRGAYQANTHTTGPPPTDQIARSSHRDRIS
jgi:hypothetical protein